MNLIKKFYASVTGVNMEERTVTAKISTQSVDRHGDVMLAKGCDASEFLKNPVVLYNHDINNPIGQCVDLQIMNDHIVAKTLFATRPADHQGEWLPDKLLALFDQGVIRGFSTGFMKGKARAANFAERKSFDRPIKRVVEQWTLAEYSVTPVPVNQDALVVMTSKALGCSVDMAKSLCGEVDPDREDPNTTDIGNDDQVVTVKMLNESVTNLLNEKLSAEPGSMLHTRLGDITEMVVKCFMAQGVELPVMETKSLDALSDDDEGEVDPELKRVVEMLEQHKPGN